MKKENIILIVGALLVCLRLIFPVLQCRLEPGWDGDCQNDRVLFFSFSPINNYTVHGYRTTTQILAIIIFFAALYFVFRSKSSSKN
jgi:hypothetical protein